MKVSNMALYVIRSYMNSHSITLSITPNNSGQLSITAWLSYCGNWHRTLLSPRDPISPLCCHTIATRISRVVYYIYSRVVILVDLIGDFRFTNVLNRATGYRSECHRFGPKVGQADRLYMGHPGLFQIRFQNILAPGAKMFWNLIWKVPKLLYLVPIWLTL